MTFTSSDALLTNLALVATILVAACEAPTRSLPSDLGPDPDPEIECGLTHTGGYIGPCSLRDADGVISTLCDESTKVCFVPKAECVDGWCTIPAASFQSGQSVDGWDRPYEAQNAGVTVVPRRFLISETEVTLADFRLTMGYVPSNSLECKDCPVGGASIFEAMAYANTKSEAAGLPACYILESCHDAVSTTPPDYVYSTWVCERATFIGPQCTGFRLPSFAEFELSARAGSPYCLSGLGPIGSPSNGYVEPDPRAVYRREDTSACPGNDGYCPPTPLPVRTTTPNPFGLYEVHGNVAEITQTHCPLSNSEVPTPGPPFALNTQPEFELVFGPDDIPCYGGGTWRRRLPYVCAHHATAIAHATGNTIHFQTSGFRLVRTIGAR